MSSEVICDMCWWPQPAQAQSATHPQPPSSPRPQDLPSAPPPPGWVTLPGHPAHPQGHLLDASPWALGGSGHALVWGKLWASSPYSCRTLKRHPEAYARLRDRHSVMRDRLVRARPQYSQSAVPAGASASARSRPEAPPRRYLPLRARMARRPRSRNSKTKSSARSPSLHTLPWLPVYQNPPPRPGGRDGVGGGAHLPAATRSRVPTLPAAHLGSGRRRR